MLDDGRVDDRADADDDGQDDDADIVDHDDDEEAFTGADDSPGDDDSEYVDPEMGPAGSARDNLSHLVEFLATNLVDDPQGVEVLAEQRGQTVGITLRVPEEELGKVIGRQGRIARAIRTVLTIASSRQNVRASLDIEG